MEVRVFSTAPFSFFSLPSQGFTAGRVGLGAGVDAVGAQASRDEQRFMKVRFMRSVSMAVAVTVFGSPLALPGLAFAQDASAQDVGDAPIIVVGSRISPPASTITAPQSVDAALPQSTLDILARMPDIRAVTSGGEGGTSLVSIRGAEPNFAQVLLDGVRVTNPSSTQGGGFDFAALDPGLVETITIIPTSRSAVHGSDALSGVIAIDLADPRADETVIAGHLTADSEEAYGAGLRGSFGWQGGGAVVAGSLYDSGDLTPGSTLEREQLFARVGQSVGDWDVTGFALYGESEREGFGDSSGGPLFAATPDLEQRDTRFLATGLTIAGDRSATLRPRVRLGYYDDNVVADTPAIAAGVLDPVPALTSDTDFDRFEATADLGITLSPQFDLVVGGNVLTESAEATGTIDFGALIPTAFAISRDQFSAFAEGAWRPVEGLTLTVAARNDWLEGDVSEATWQASGEYAFGTSGLTAFAGYAEGFRLPSLFALAFPLLANPDLRPERSESWEGGVRFAQNGTRITASVFRNDYTDLIDFAPELFTNVNRAQTQISGFTVSGESQLSNALLWSAAVTHIDIDSADEIRGRPDWYGNASLIWSALNTLDLGASAVFNSSFTELSIPTGVAAIDGHFAVDLHGALEVNEALTFSLALRNVFDADYQEAVGFPAPGRHIRAKLGFRF